ncbi:MAG: prepilin-type N-terminal cleavage/methylation domain-containing protein [bacterium]|nr:prepilin-type N-terminal cleavage/methylation domain-containing protein [bacterium]
MCHSALDAESRKRTGFRLLGRNDRAFTLIELLIVIGILSILATVVLLVINPAQMIRQSRDGNRLAEINQINKSLLIFQSFGGSGMGTHTKVYVSLPSSNADCSDLGLPALGGGYTYVCSNSTNYRKIDGTGWVPVDLTSVQSSAGTLFASLPIDPVNTVANGYYYTYIPGSWALSATMESDKYLAINAAVDGGQVSTRFEVGNEIALGQYLGSDLAAATAPTNIVLAVGSTAPVGGVTNVAIPAAGATDTTGAVTGWVTSTADKIKFTVTDGGSAVSTITIGGGAYTSGADYAIPSTTSLSIVVTTTESGKTTGVRTFTVTVAAIAFSATGGDITYSGGYTIHTYKTTTTDKTFTPNTAGNVEVLVVAGGGGGGTWNGGGGAGGLIYNAAFPVTAQAYTITIGNGGGQAVSGQNSVFSSLTAIGGGAGGADGAAGVAGGSGGGGGGANGGAGGSGTTNQGYAGGYRAGFGSPYPAGGGGGAGGLGGDALNANQGGVGGVGLQYSISGSATWYAGGGGGGISCGGAAGGIGGSGVGGNSAKPPTSGAPHTGSGGGGYADCLISYSATGGSGIVIIRYLTN